MRITKIHLENFCGLKALDADIYLRTLISGVNESGKSTIRRAIFWCFNVRDENGKEITGIRPHDENGVDNLEAETVAEITLDNGIVLKKVFRAAFDKRGNFKGNATDCYVSGIPKSATEYSEYVRGLVPADECINAQAFFSLDTNGRRKMLEDAFGQLSSDELIGRLPEYEELREHLKVGTVAELKKAWNYELNGDKRHKGLKDSLADIPTRIDEVERQGGGVEVAELSLAVSGLEKDIAELDSQEAELDEATKTYDAAAQGVLELKFEQSEIVRKANEGIVKARSEVADGIFNLQQAKRQAERELSESKQSLQKLNADIERYLRDIKNEQERYKRAVAEEYDEDRIDAIRAEEFDEKSLICPTCKRPLEQEQQETIRTAWESSKASRLAEAEREKEEWEKGKEERVKRIVEDGTTISNVKKKALAEKEGLEKTVAELDRKITEIAGQIAAKQSALDVLPTEADLSQNAEYAALTAQISAKEAALENMPSGADRRAEIKRERAQKQDELNRLQSQILARQKTEADKEKRIEELRGEQVKLAQAVADVEKRIDLLKNFERQKNELLESEVNAGLKYTKIKMFEKNIGNDDFKDVCRITVNGTSFDTTLNLGNKILAEIDLILAFQRKYGVELPVILDNMESLDSWRLPEVGQQLIALRRTDEDGLAIKEM